MEHLRSNYPALANFTYLNSSSCGLVFKDLLSFLSLKFPIKQHAKIGFDNIQQQIKKVKTYAHEKITNDTNFSEKTSVNEYLESGILSVEAKRLKNS